MQSDLRANQAESPECSLPDDGAQSRPGGGEVLPHGPGDVRGSTEHTEVGPAGRCRKAAEGTPRWYLPLHFIHASNRSSSAFLTWCLELASRC